MTIVTVESLTGRRPLQYNLLTKDTEYLAGGQYFDWLERKPIDAFRVGGNTEEEFCIEDSIGRAIPFRLEDIDSLIDVLLAYRQDNDKNIKIASLQAQIRELETDGD